MDEPDDLAAIRNAPLFVRMTRRERQDCNAAARALVKPTSEWAREILLAEAALVNAASQPPASGLLSAVPLTPAPPPAENALTDAAGSTQ